MEFSSFLYIFALIILVVGLLLLLGMYIYKRGQKETKKVEIVNVEPAPAVNTITTASPLQWSNKSDFVSFCQNKFKEQRVEVMSSWYSETPCVFPALYGLMTSRFNMVNKVGKSEESGSYTYLVYECSNIVNSKPITSYMRIVKRSEEAKNWDGKQNIINKFKYKNKEGQETIDIVEEINFIFPDTSSQFSIKRENVATAVEETKVTWVEYREPEDSRIYTLVNAPYRGWKLKPDTLTGWGLSPEEMETNYRDNIEILIREKWMPTNSRLFEIILETARSGHSVGFLGIPGSGKSRMLQNVVSTLGQSDDVRIVLCTKPVLERLTSDDGSILDVLDPTKKNILVVEEGKSLVQKDQELFKMLTDSGLSRKVSLSIIFSCNLTDDEIHASVVNGVFRTGRCLVVRINPLQKDNANKVASRLQELAKKSKEFVWDNAYEEEIGQNPEQLLADVYSFAKRPEIARLEGLIAEAVENNVVFNTPVNIVPNGPVNKDNKQKIKISADASKISHPNKTGGDNRTRT